MTKDFHLIRPLFLISIIILLTNDLYLKYEYHNFLTGKLSDFAGLFAFPLFLSYFYPKSSKVIYILTAILFIFWKSELSQPIFETAKTFNIGINRTIDYTDLIALLIIPVSFSYWKTDFKKSIISNSILKPLIIGICCFAFIATTLPKEVGSFNMDSNLKLKFLKVDIEEIKDKLDLYENDEKTKFVYWFQVPEKKARISSLISVEQKKDILVIKLDSILNYVIESNSILASGINQEDINYLKNLKKSEIENMFSQQLEKAIKIKK